MFIVTHAAIGAIIGEKANDPFIAAAGGFVAHFIADIIPHGDTKMYFNYKRGEDIRRALAYVVVDGVATVFFVLMLFNFRDFQHPLNVSLGIAFGILPDLLVGLFEMGRARWLVKFHALHFYFHNMVSGRKFDLSFRAGFAMQLVLLTLLQLRVF